MYRDEILKKLFVPKTCIRAIIENNTDFKLVPMKGSIKEIEKTMYF